MLCLVMVFSNFVIPSEAAMFSTEVGEEIQNIVEGENSIVEDELQEESYEEIVNDEEETIVDEDDEISGEELIDEEIEIEETVSDEVEISEEALGAISGSIKVSNANMDADGNATIIKHSGTETFTTVVNGPDETPAYQWYISSDQWGNNPIAIDGETGDTLTIDAEEYGQKYYLCRASYTAGDIESAVFSVVIKASNKKILEEKLAINGDSTESVDKMDEYGYSWDKSTKTLTLDGFSSICPRTPWTPSVSLTGVDKIVVKNNNAIVFDCSSNDQGQLQSSIALSIARSSIGEVTIEGDGSLYTRAKGYALFTNNKVTALNIKKANVICESTYSIPLYARSGSESTTLNITDNAYVECNFDLKHTAYEPNEKCAIYCNNIVVKDSTLKCSADSNGLNLVNGNHGRGTVAIDINNEGFALATSIFENSDIYLKATGDKGNMNSILRARNVTGLIPLEHSSFEGNVSNPRFEAGYVVDGSEYLAEAHIVPEPYIEAKAEGASHATEIFINTQESTTMDAIAETMYGSATLSYQWYRTFDAEKTNIEAISGENDYRFNRPTGTEDPIKKCGTYMYFCRVSAQGFETVDTNIVTIHVGIKDTKRTSDKLEINSATEDVDRLGSMGYAWEKSTKTLTLDGAQLFNRIAININDDVTISLKSDSLVEGLDYTAAAGKTLTITSENGGSELTIATEGEANKALSTVGNLVIDENAKVSVYKKNESGKVIDITEGKLTVNGYLCAQREGTDSNAAGIYSTVMADGGFVLPVTTKITYPEDGKVDSSNTKIVTETELNPAKVVMEYVAIPEINITTNETIYIVESEADIDLVADFDISTLNMEPVPSEFTYKWYRCDSDGNNKVLFSTKTQPELFLGLIEDNRNNNCYFICEVEAEYNSTIYSADTDVIQVCFSDSEKLIVDRDENLDFKSLATVDNTDEGWTWNASTKTLTLDGAVFSFAKGKRLILPADAIIILAENSENWIYASDNIGGNVALQFNGYNYEGTIKGNGKLNISGDVYTAIDNVKYIKDGAHISICDNSQAGIVISCSLVTTLTIDDAKIDIEIGKIDSSAIWCNGKVDITNSEIDIKALDSLSNGTGISASNTITVINSDIRTDNTSMILKSNRATNGEAIRLFGEKITGIDNYEIKYLNSASSIYNTDSNALVKSGEILKSGNAFILITSGENASDRVRSKNIAELPTDITVEAALYGAMGELEYNWYKCNSQGEDKVWYQSGANLVPEAVVGETKYICEVSLKDSELKEYTGVYSVYLAYAGRRVITSTNSHLAFDETSPSVDNLSTFGYKWDKETKTLTLDGVVMRNGEITLPAGSTVVVTEGKDNIFIESTATFAFANDGDSNTATDNTVKGSGKMIFIAGGGTADKTFAVSGNDNLIFEGGVDITTLRAIVSVDGNIVVKDASISLDEDCYGANNGLVSTNGDIIFEEGAKVVVGQNYNAAILANNGNITINEGANVVAKSRRLSISCGGKLTVNGVLEAGGLVNDYEAIHAGSVEYASKITYPVGNVEFVNNTFKVDNSLVTRITFYEIDQLVELDSIGNIVGNAVCDQTLETGEVLPVNADCEYQWQVCDTADGAYQNIEGAKEAQYTIDSYLMVGKYIRVAAIGNRQTDGIVYSEPVGPIQANPAKFASVTCKTSRGTVALNNRPLPDDSWSPDELEYEYVVPSLIDKVELTVGTVNDSCEVEINGIAGNSQDISLPSYGINAVTIVVTDKDSNNSTTYTLNVKRSDPAYHMFKLDSDNGTELGDKVIVASWTDRNSNAVNSITIDKNNKTASADILPDTEVTIKVTDGKAVDTGYLLYSLYTDHYVGADLYDDLYLNETNWKEETFKFVTGDDNVIYRTRYLVNAPVSGKANWNPTGKIVTIDFSEYMRNDNGVYKLYAPSQAVSGYDKFVIDIYDADNELVDSLVYNIDSNTYVVDELKADGKISLSADKIAEIGIDNSKEYKFRISSFDSVSFNENVPADLKYSFIELESYNPKFELEDSRNVIVIDNATAAGAEEYSESGTKYIAIKIPENVTDADLTGHAISSDRDIIDNVVFKSSGDGNGKIYFSAKAYEDEENHHTGTSYISIFDMEWKLKKTIRVDVVNKDIENSASFVIESSTVSPNVYSKTGSDIQVSFNLNDREITAITFDNADLNTYFDIVEKDYDTFTVKVKENVAKDDALIKAMKASYISPIRITVGGNVVVSGNTIVVKPVKTKPVVKTKALTFNTFLENETQEVAFISTNATVSKIMVDSSKATAKTPAIPAWAEIDENNKTVTVSNLGNNGKGNLFLICELNEWYLNVPLTVSLVCKKTVPAIKLAEKSLDVTEKDNDDLVLTLVSSNKSKKLEDFDVTGIRVATAEDLAKLSAKDSAKYAVSENYLFREYDQTNGKISLKVADGNGKTGTLLLIATIGNNSKQEVMLPITVKMVTPAITLSAKKVVLNKSLFSDNGLFRTDKASVNVKISPAAYYQTGFSLDGDTIKVYNQAGELCPNHGDDVPLNIVYGSGKLTLHPADGAKAGKYKVVVCDDKGNAKDASFEVVVEEKAPKLSLTKTSGTLNVFGGAESTPDIVMKMSDNRFPLDNKHFVITETNNKLKCLKDGSSWYLMAADAESISQTDKLYFKMNYSSANNAFSIIQQATAPLTAATYNLEIKYVAEEYTDNNGVDVCVSSSAKYTLKTNASNVTIKASKSSVTLNKASNADRADIVITPSVAKVLGNALSLETTIYEANKKTTPVPQPLTVGIYNGNTLGIRLLDNAAYGKTYYVKVEGKYGRLQTEKTTNAVFIKVAVSKENVKPSIVTKATGYIDFNNMDSAVTLKNTITNFCAVDSVAASNITYKVYAMNGKKICQDSWVDDTTTGEVTSKFDYDAETGLVTRTGDIDERMTYYIELAVKINNTSYPGKRVKLPTKFGPLKVNVSTKSVTLKKYDKYDIAYISVDPEYKDDRDSFDRVKIANPNSNFRITKIRKGLYAIQYKYPRSSATVKSETIKLQFFGEGKVDTDIKPNSEISIKVNIK